MAAPYVQQQPMATPGMMAVGGNRNAKNLPMTAEGRDWSNGLFDCCNDASTCFLAWCCPCVVYGQNKQRLEYLQSKGQPDPEAGGCCNSDCIIHAAITGCFGAGWILQMMNRGNVRGRYSVKGGGCGDCMSSCCCAPCALTQESQEIALEEQSFTGGYQKA
ncbi:putative PLAC8 family protein [Lyophyllum shimeji]|uniref:PLAC8 family protein n=1 Tax=Lyophyllum shimeji TaxID=47721 RepID=A0A9P3UN32_LYOSH|nr:putative PLAC8 family protein [Lyophyllum shimeji]